jgi:hypothetical protein
MRNGCSISDGYFTEKAAEIDKECHIKEQNGKSNSTDDSLEVSLKNCKFCAITFTTIFTNILIY